MDLMIAPGLLRLKRREQVPKRRVSGKRPDVESRVRPVYDPAVGRVEAEHVSSAHEVVGGRHDRIEALDAYDRELAVPDVCRGVRGGRDGRTRGAAYSCRLDSRERGRGRFDRIAPDDDA